MYIIIIVINEGLGELTLWSNSKFGVSKLPGLKYGRNAK